MSRVALMVDTRSLGKAVQRQTGGRMQVDYNALPRLGERGARQTLNPGGMDWQEERGLVFVAAYLGPSNSARQERLVTSLSGMGYIVKVCENGHTGASKSSTDLTMFRDAFALMYTNKIDVLVLVTADSDFHLVTEGARNFGIQVELVSVAGQVTETFARSADIFVDCMQAGLLKARLT